MAIPSPATFHLVLFLCFYWLWWKQLSRWVYFYDRDWEITRWSNNLSGFLKRLCWSHFPPVGCDKREKPCRSLIWLTLRFSYQTAIHLIRIRFCLVLVLFFMLHISEQIRAVIVPGKQKIFPGTNPRIDLLKLRRTYAMRDNVIVEKQLNKENNR